MFCIGSWNGTPLNMYLLAFTLKAPASATTTPNPDVIPEFEVWDSSSISIKETATDLQRSLAINGFSTRSIEAALYVPYNQLIVSKSNAQ